MTTKKMWSAKMTALLASNEAAYITGRTYVIDGGQMVEHHEQSNEEENDTVQA